MSDKKAAKPQKTYKIVQLQSENVKRLKAISISPDGNIINVTGKNDNGKTSVLDSIWWAVGGDKVISDMPIRGGEQKAKITLDLGEMVVTRTFTAKDEGGYTTKVKIEVEDGFTADKPQRMLDAIVGELSFDPMQFVSMKPKDQFEMLKGFVPGFDFNVNANQRKEAFDSRTGVNRLARDLSGAIAGIAVPEDTPDVEIDISDLTEELRQVGVHNQQINERKIRRQQVADNIERIRNDAFALDARAEGLEEEIKRIQKQILALNNESSEKLEEAAAEQKRLDEAEELPAEKDGEEIQQRIRDAGMQNTVIRQKNLLKQMQDRLAGYETEANALTDKIKAFDDEKEKAISEAKMPVDGLGFGDGVVLLNGYPFADASKAQQIAASLQLAMSSKPRLRIAFIRDGSLLDSDSMKVIAKLAADLDIQIWLETVEKETPGAIVIEDGSVARIVDAAE